MLLSDKSDNRINREINKASGFTLAEFAVVGAIVAILIGSFTLYVRSFQGKTDIRDAAIVLAQAVHRSRGASIAVDGDSPWGTYVQATSAIVFRGATYATRTSSYDEYYVFPPSMTATGTKEFDFSKFYGTTTAGTSTITSTTAATSTSVVVNSQGIVSY